MSLKHGFFLLIGLVAGYLLSNQTQQLPGESQAQIVSEATQRQLTRVQADELVPESSPLAPITFSSLGNQATIFDTLYTAYTLAASAEAGEAKDYVEASMAIDDPLFSANIADIFLERLTALDARESMAFVEGMPASQSRQRLMISVLNTWVRMDAAAALNYLETVEDLQFRRLAASVLTKDAGLPESVIETSQEILTASIVELRGNRALVGGSGSRYARGTQLREDMAAIQRQLGVDPEGTMADLMAMSPSREKQMLMEGALRQLATSDPDLAMTYLQDYPEALAFAKSQVLSIVASKNPEQFRAEIEEHARRTGDTNPISNMISAMMQSDKAAALAYYDAQAQHVKQRLGFQLGYQLVQEDAYAGLQWILEQDDQTRGMLASVVSSSNPETATEAERLLSELPAGDDDRQRLMVAISQGRSRTDPRSALDWLSQYKGEAAYDSAYAQVLSQWANNDPAAAAAQLASEPIQSNNQHVYSSLANRWAQFDPDAAESWAMSLQDDSTRSLALSSLVSVYASTELSRAKDLYFQLPEGPGKDRAGANLALRAAGGTRDPDRLRSTMEDLDLPEEVIQSYITVWAQQ